MDVRKERGAMPHFHHTNAATPQVCQGIVLLMSRVKEGLGSAGTNRAGYARPRSIQHDGQPSAPPPLPLGHAKGTRPQQRRLTPY